MNTDTIHGYQHAGYALSPIADFGLNFAIVFGPGLLLVGALILAWPAARGIWRSLRAADQWIHEQLQALPAPADDNQASADVLTASNQTREETP